MNRRPLRAITEAEVAAYQSDGVVLLKGLFDLSWVEVSHNVAFLNRNPNRSQAVVPSEDVQILRRS